MVGKRRMQPRLEQRYTNGRKDWEQIVLLRNEKKERKRFLSEVPVLKRSTGRSERPVRSRYLGNWRFKVRTLLAGQPAAE